MSTTDPDYDNFDDDEPTENQNKAIAAMRKEIKTLNETNAKLREDAEAGQTAVLENALYQADLGSLNQRQRTAIIASADDKSPDAFRKAAEELGFIDPPKEPEVPSEELAEQARIHGSTTGGEQPGSEDAYLADMQAARSPAEVEAVMLKHNRGGFHDTANQ